MSHRDKLSKYLKNLQSNLLLGDETTIVERVARGILEHPENKLKSVRVWTRRGKRVELVCEVGERLYEPDYGIPADYAPFQIARAKGFAITTRESPWYDPQIERGSEYSSQIYWKPDKFVSVELQPSAMNDQHARLQTIEMVARTFSATLKEETFRNVVRGARTLQDSLLPDDPLEVKGYDAAMLCRTVSLAGGDFLFHKSLNHSTILGIGDSEGKGSEAAQKARDCVTYLHAFFDGNPISQLTSGMESLNDYFRSGKEKTVSLVLARFSDDGRMAYVNAGHVYPFLVKADGSAGHLEKTDLLLGVLRGIPYHSEHPQLAKGDVVFMYTDGLTEAKDENDEMYSDERLIGVLRESRNLSCDEIVKAVWADSDAFRRSRPLLDDTIILAVKYLGASHR